jgi:hypothetical protein
MTHLSDNFPPSDVCLMLRVDAERRWLSREVIPVLRQLRDPDGLPEEQLGAALAYLEVTWLEARRLAAETDATFAEMDTPGTAYAEVVDTAAARQASGSPRAREEALSSKACRYHAAVHTLRDTVERNVQALVSAPREELVTHYAEHARG